MKLCRLKMDITGYIYHVKGSIPYVQHFIYVLLYSFCNTRVLAHYDPERYNTVFTGATVLAGYTPPCR
jgi:hypothetical protein